MEKTLNGKVLLKFFLAGYVLSICSYALCVFLDMNGLKEIIRPFTFIFGVPMTVIFVEMRKWWKPVIFNGKILPKLK